MTRMWKTRADRLRPSRRGNRCPTKTRKKTRRAFASADTKRSVLNVHERRNRHGRGGVSISFIFTTRSPKLNHYGREQHKTHLFFPIHPGRQHAGLRLVPQMVPQRMCWRTRRHFGRRGVAVSRMLPIAWPVTHTPVRYSSLPSRY